MVVLDLPSGPPNESESLPSSSIANPSCPRPVNAPPPETRKAAQQDALISRARRAKLLANFRSQAAQRRTASAQATAQARAEWLQGLPDGVSLVAAHLPPQWVTLPPWLHAFDPSHRLLYVGGLVGCTACGGIVSPAAPSSLLCDRRPSRGTLPAESESRVRRFRQGLLPANFSTWPDGRTAPRYQRPR